MASVSSSSSPNYERRSVFWKSAADGTGVLHLLDQRELPHKYEYVQHSKMEEVVESIKVMLVRGAPAIGAAGGVP